MSARRAWRYNQIARPTLEAHGIEIIDTFRLSAAQPGATQDGVHFPSISQQFLQDLLRAVCRTEVL